MSSQGETGEAGPDVAGPVDPLRLGRCPGCDYLLTGLPAEGVCPECGFRYDPSMVVLWGWARGLRSSGVNTRFMVDGWLRVGFLVLMLLPMLAAILIASAGAVPSDITLLVLPVAVLMVVVVTVGRRRRLLGDRPAPVQLRLMPEGFGQRDGIGPVELQRWDDRVRLYVRYRRRGHCRIRSYRLFSIGFTTGGDIVDFDWRCDAQTAERLRHRIESLHKASQECREIHRLCRKGRLSSEEAERRVRGIREQMRRQGFWRRGAA